MNIELLIYEVKKNHDIKALTIKAAEGDVTAQLHLGVYHTLLAEHESDVPMDPAEGVRLLESAAKRVNSIALFCLSICYFSGWGTPQNETRAFENLELAAKNGYSSAQLFLGIIYFFNNQPDGMKTAVKLFQQAADQNNPAAKCALAYCYLTGNGFPLNTIIGTELVTAGVEQGFIQAQIELGHAWNVTSEQALKWYRLEVQYGVTQASLRLYEKIKIYVDDPLRSYVEVSTAANESIDVAKNLQILAQTPELFDEIALEYSLKELKKILPPACYQVVEKRRKDYALGVESELKAFTPIINDVRPGIVDYLLPADDVRFFTKRPVNHPKREDLMEEKCEPFKIPSRGMSV